MRLGQHTQGVGQDTGAAVGRKDDLRADVDRAVVLVGSQVIEGNVDGHGDSVLELRVSGLRMDLAMFMPRRIAPWSRRFEANSGPWRLSPHFSVPGPVILVFIGAKMLLLEVFQC